LDSWAKVASAKLEPTTVPKGEAVMSPSSSMHPALVAFEVSLYQLLLLFALLYYLFFCVQRFLQQTGGRQGGWDDFDHKAFVKIKIVYSGVS